MSDYLAIEIKQGRGQGLLLTCGVPTVDHILWGDFGNSVLMRNMRLYGNHNFDLPDIMVIVRAIGMITC